MPTPISGTVRISGPVSPFNVEDTYPATDPQYGLGGLRTVGTTGDMEAISVFRRQQGMIVYVSGLTAYYALIGTTANSGWTTGFTFGRGSGGGGGIVGDYVATFNGLTGAVTGVTVGGVNTFINLNTFNAGISASSAYVSTGSTFGGRLDVVGVFDVVSGATFEGTTDYAGAARFASTVTGTTATFTTNIITPEIRPLAAGAGITIGQLAGSGGNTIRLLASILDVGPRSTTNPSGLTLSTVSGVTFTIAPRHNMRIKPDPALKVNNSGDPAIFFNSVGSELAFDGALYSFSGHYDGNMLAQYNPTIDLYTTENKGGNRLRIVMPTIGGNIGVTLPSSSGTIALLESNTFTGLQTFAAGITTSSIYASTGSTFGGTVQIIRGATVGGRLDVGGAFDVVGGATFESTTDYAGAARFASTVTTTGAITANGGITASALDVTGLAKFNGNVTVGDAATDVLTVTSGATFGATDHTGAARFASTVTTSGDVTVGATLTVSGNFLVSGTVTTVNRTDLNIDDKTITMGRTLGNDALADGGGLVLKGSSDRTWTWSQTRGWESSQGVNVASGSAYSINGTSVLNSTTLGSSVVSSSLTSVGTIGTGIWQGTVVGATYGGTGRSTYTIGDVLFANGTSSLSVLGASTAGRLLAANGTGTAPEYKQLLIRDADANSIASEASGAGTLTLTIQNASTTLKGVAKFDSEMFTATSGNVSVFRIDGGTY